jgi:hypothetical protein
MCEILVNAQRIRAFVNRPNGVGFEEVEAASSVGGGRAAGVGSISSGKPQADFLLQEGTAGVTEYPVSISRFQNVHAVTLVVVSIARSGPFLTHLPAPAHLSLSSPLSLFPSLSLPLSLSSLPVRCSLSVSFSPILSWISRHSPSNQQRGKQSISSRSSK